MQCQLLTDVLQDLAADKPVVARIEEAGCDISFDPVHPYVCTAIHDGHRFAPDLEPLCQLSPDDRVFEEDPHTGTIALGLANNIVGLDSRYEYDLNRPPDAAIHDIAWGREVWHGTLPAELAARSLAKHTAFYQVVDAVLAALMRRHGGGVVYDLHSYNGRRKGGTAAPAFNIGTEQIDKRRHRRSIDQMARQLAAVEIEGEGLRTAIDEVFYGRGYLATRCRQYDAKILCLPIEIRKFFCIEETGVAYPTILADLKRQLVAVISQHAHYFATTQLKKKFKSRYDLLSSSIDRQVIELDRKLFSLARNLETLLYINPINMDGEKSLFLARHSRNPPSFRYRKLSIDPFAIKEALYRLDVEKINDATIQALYRRAVEGLAAEVDLIASIGSRECLYNSLRYYGEPFGTDLDNARFLLHAPDIDNGDQKTEILHEDQIVAIMQQEVAQYKLDAPVLRSNRIVAGAMVDNANYRVLVRRGLSQTRQAVDALRHHEVGIHLLTAAEARRQPLRLFRLGLPGSTETQEGLAVLAEYLSGNLTMARLRTLALRVIAVRSLIDDYDFTRTFHLLIDEYKASRDEAWIITTRVFRGGGFTKDYLYLRGLARALDHWKSGRPLETLLIGKSSFRDVITIEELMGRGVLPRPQLTPAPFAKPADVHPIHDYLLSALRFED